MEINPEKHVEFHKYCMDCKYFKLEETEDPCFECLDNPVNEYSHRPVKFKEKDSRKN